MTASNPLSPTALDIGAATDRSSSSACPRPISPSPADETGHRSGWLDLAGITVSVLCAIHCAASGIFIAALALLGLGNRMPAWLEWGFLGASLLLGGAALGRGQRCHGDRGAVRLFVGGATVLILTRVAGESVQAVEPLLVLVGAGSIITAHARNWREERRCRHRARNAKHSCATHTPLER